MVFFNSRILGAHDCGGQAISLEVINESLGSIRFAVAPDTAQEQLDLEGSNNMRSSALDDWQSTNNIAVLYELADTFISGKMYCSECNYNVGLRLQASRAEIKDK